MLLAVTDVSRYTRLTEAIFSALISCIFIFGAHMKAYSGYRRGEMQIQVRWRPLTKGRRRLGRGVCGERGGADLGEMAATRRRPVALARSIRDMAAPYTGTRTRPAPVGTLPLLSASLRGFQRKESD